MKLHVCIGRLIKEKKIQTHTPMCVYSDVQITYTYVGESRLVFIYMCIYKSDIDVSQQQQQQYHTEEIIHIHNGRTTKKIYNNIKLETIVQNKMQ